jgi:hypothetical protein
MKAGWFGPKRIGFGVSPTSWQGWAVTVVLLAALAVSIRWAQPLLAEAMNVPLPVATGCIVAAWLAIFGAVIALTYDGGRS